MHFSCSVWRSLPHEVLDLPGSCIQCNRAQDTGAKTIGGSGVRSVVIPQGSSSAMGFCLHVLQAVACSAVEEETLKSCDILQESILVMQ